MDKPIWMHAANMIIFIILTTYFVSDLVSNLSEFGISGLPIFQSVLTVGITFFTLIDIFYFIKRILGKSK
jgi:hypothetical protein